MSQKGEIILYQDSEGETQIEVQLDNETVWLSLMQLVKLFQRNKSVISRHISNIYKSGELDEASTVAKKSIVQTEGGRTIRREIEYYNLDMIVSVGYRVNSRRGIQFRQWATQTLINHIRHEIWQNAGEMFTKLMQSGQEIRETAGYVYLIKSPTGHYKIGRTGHLNNRFKTFAVKLPFEIEPVHVIWTENMLATERILHRHMVCANC